ncbi:MAG: aconitase family protein [Thermoanaerobaculia bacterium]
MPIDIAYGGSCTAGKIDDLDFYHRVVAEAVDAGMRVAPGVRFLISSARRRSSGTLARRGTWRPSRGPECW